jgi:hypothetical protein
MAIAPSGPTHSLVGPTDFSEIISIWSNTEARATCHRRPQQGEVLSYKVRGRLRRLGTVLLV